MSTDTVQAPGPLWFGPFLRRGDGSHLVIERARFGDLIDLTTGECHLARVIAGVRCDTRRATLVVGSSSAAGGYFFFRQLFRGHDGHWFLVTLTYDVDWGECDDGFIGLLTEDQVLPKLREVLAGEDCWPLLRDWYVRGWVPRDDAFVQEWAEAMLPADEYEFVVHSFATIPSDPTR